MATLAINVTPQMAYEKIRAMLKTMKVSSDKIDVLLANDIDRKKVYDYGLSIEQQYSEMIIYEVAGIPQIDTWAKVAESNPAYDFTNEYAATKTAITDMLTTIRSAFPESTNNYIELQQFVGPSTLELTSGTFLATSQGMITLRGLVQSLSASIG